MLETHSKLFGYVNGLRHSQFQYAVNMSTGIALLFLFSFTGMTAVIGKHRTIVVYVSPPLWSAGWK